MKDKCPGSAIIKSPVPEELVCYVCHFTNEIWSDEPEMYCKNCGSLITRDMPPSCILWCPSARQCIGDEKYEKLSKKYKEMEDR